MKRRIVLAAALALTLAGCAGPRIDDYAAEKPVLDLKQYFNGTLDAYGIVTDRSGKAVKRYAVGGGPVADHRWRQLERRRGGA